MKEFELIIPYNEFMVSDRPLKVKLDEISQMFHEIEVDSLAKHFDVDSSAIEYFYNRYGTMPFKHIEYTEYYPYLKKRLFNHIQSYNIV